MQGEKEEPKFIAAAEHQLDAVAFLDSVHLQEVRRALGSERKVLEGEDMLFIVVVAPDESFFLRFLFCVNIDNVIGEVEVFRNVNFEVFVKIFVRAVIDFIDEV